MEPFSKKIYFISSYVYVCWSVYEYVHVRTDALREGWESNVGHLQDLYVLLIIKLLLQLKIQPSCYVV